MKSLAHSELYPLASLAVIKEAGQQLAAGASSTVVTVEAIRKDGRRIWVENRVRTLVEGVWAGKDRRAQPTGQMQHSCTAASLTQG